MNASRIAAIAGRILRQFRHDPRTVGLILVVPTVVMVLVGYLVGDSGKEPLPIAVVEEAGRSPTEPGAFASLLDAQPTIEVTRRPADATAARELVREGDVVAAVVVSRADGTVPQVRIEVVVRGVDPGVDGAVAGALRSVVEGADVFGAASAPVVVEQVRLDAGSDLGTLDYYAPALIVIFVFLFTFMLTSVAFLRERSSGTLDRLMASPASRLDLLLGYLLGFIGFAMTQTLVILGYAALVLDVAITGPVWVVLLTLAILVIGVVNLGIALSFYARNELQVIQFIPLLLVPQIFLGGLFWPVETLWPPLRYLSQVLPVTHAVAALREVMLGGAGFTEVAARLVALVAFAVAMVLLGVLALRKQRA